MAVWGFPVLKILIRCSSYLPIWAKGKSGISLECHVTSCCPQGAQAVDDDHHDDDETHVFLDKARVR